MFVTGAGRSGTSTVAGSLKYLGLHVPQPEVAANKTNPRGFFESRWAVDFHKRVLESAAVATLDASPAAPARVATVLERPKIRAQMEDWLAGAVGQAGQIVLKDPRTVWAIPSWHDRALAAGTIPSYVTMMRHPAEVVGSRATYYSKATDEAKARIAQVRNLAGWVNTNLVNEAATRGHPRAFVQYNDLISDWRAAMSAVGRRLDLVFDTDIDGGARHEIDDFIDPDLRRVRITFCDLDVPRELRDIAEGTWDALCELAQGSLAGTEAADSEAQERLDTLAVRYARLHEDSLAIVDTSLRPIRQKARRAGARAERAKASDGTPTDHVPTASRSPRRRLVDGVRRAVRSRR